MTERVDHGDAGNGWFGGRVQRWSVGNLPQIRLGDVEAGDDAPRPEGMDGVLSMDIKF